MVAAAGNLLPCHRQVRFDRFNTNDALGQRRDTQGEQTDVAAEIDHGVQSLVNRAEAVNVVVEDFLENLERHAVGRQRESSALMVE